MRISSRPAAAAAVAESTESAPPTVGAARPVSAMRISSRPAAAAAVAIALDADADDEGDAQMADDGSEAVPDDLELEFQVDARQFIAAQRLPPAARRKDALARVAVGHARPSALPVRATAARDRPPQEEDSPALPEPPLELAERHLRASDMAIAPKAIVHDRTEITGQVLAAIPADAARSSAEMVPKKLAAASAMAVDGVVPAAAPAAPATGESGGQPAAAAATAAAAAVAVGAANAVYAIETLLAKRKRAGRVEFLVKWADYPRTQATWEPRVNLPLGLAGQMRQLGSAKSRAKAKARRS
jgi:hypothetical protein